MGLEGVYEGGSMNEGGRNEEFEIGLKPCHTRQPRAAGSTCSQGSQPELRFCNPEFQHYAGDVHEPVKTIGNFESPLRQKLCAVVGHHYREVRSASRVDVSTNLFFCIRPLLY